MLRDGIIPSNCPWNSPILVVPKREYASGRNGESYTSNVTIGDSFPIPVISEILDALRKPKDLHN